MIKDKKKIVIWLVVLSFLFFGMIKIYESGQGHGIFIENFQIEDLPPLGDVYYSMDGGKILKVKTNKKSKVDVKGKKHIINLSYKTKENKKIIVEKEFIIKKNYNATISIGKLVYKDNVEWISYKEMYK